MNFKIKMHIKALNLAQIFEKFRQLNVVVAQIKKGEDFKAEFVIDKKHLGAAKKILESFNADILEIQHIGAGKILQTILARICVPIALIFAFFGAFIANFFIFKVDIRGVSTISSAEIRNYLQGENIGCFTSKPAINIPALELGLLEKFPQISMVSVMTKGLTLVVNIKEKENYNLNEQNDIIANFNGRITSINIISGTGNVKVGDMVKEGDVLVCAISNNQTIKAEASITAEVWIESTYCHFDTTYQTLRTGKKKVFNNVLFMGLPIYQNSSNPVPFKNYEVESAETTLKNTILPIQIQTNTYYEVETIEIKSDFEIYKADIIDHCKKNALQKCLQGDIIKSEKSVISAGNGCTYVSYVITAHRQL